MPVLAHLDDIARAECLGDLPWGACTAIARKHGLNIKRLHEARYAHRGKQPPRTTRPIALPDPVAPWSPKRRAAVVVALRRGEITIGDALARYSMTIFELADWWGSYRDHSDERLVEVQPRRRV